jgi:hypothetical protein
VSEAGGAGGGSRPIFSARTAIILAVVGVFAFSAFVTLLAFTGGTPQNVDCRPNVYARCAIGFAGLAEAIGADGAPAVVSRNAPLAQGRSEGLLIATPEPGGGADVAGLGFGGPVLVVLPKWETTPDPNNPNWADKAGLVAPADMPFKDSLQGLGVRRLQGVARPQLWGQRGTPLEGASLLPGPIDQLQTLTAPNGWVPVLTDNAGNVVMAEAPGTRIFVLSDPDLLNTQGLASVDTFADAGVLIRSLRNGDGPVIFDATLDGFKNDKNPLRLMFDPPFLAVTLCLAGALLLVGFQSLFRFGAVRRPVRALALGKEALTDNSAQLIRLARREARMAPGYVALNQKAAARAVGAPKELAGEALVGFLDRVGAQRGLTDTLAGMTAEAATVSGRAALTGLAARLYRWRLEMTRERQ